MQIIECPSPNFNARKLSVSVLIMHYTGMQSGQEALDRLCDEAAGVSAHYLVEEDGRVFRMVEESQRAWHAGQGFWRGITDINSASIGIEIVNPGHEWGYRDFPKIQMESVRLLSQAILSRHAIDPRNVIGHSDIAPTRKEDPGEKFDWRGLAQHGIGIYPREAECEADLADKATAWNIATIQQKLALYGYGIENSGVWDTQTQSVVKAFQRHFVPHEISGQWNDDCTQILESLLQLA